ncbi:MAG: TetR/AcrR family transcriptional regulator [Ruminococcus sp.]|nr:TetR/AcrR family transcriptional regulator [Ruminococcus sp.]
MNHKDNRRVQMTKQLLRDSLLELLKEEDIHKISIRRLCELADVNRSTFYKYYSSQYDLLKDMEDRLLEQIQGQLGEQSKLTDHERLINIIDFLRTHLDLSKMLINTNVNPEFPKRVLYLPIIQEKINEKYTLNNGAESTYFIDFLLYGSYQIIRRWVNNGCLESPKELAEIIDSIFQKII